MKTRKNDAVNTAVSQRREALGGCGWWLLACLVAGAWHSWSAPAQPAVTSAPNIIVILTDDHGWADLGCQGVRQDIRTPELDTLAKEGVRCTAAYVTAPMCVPSRAGLLTGRYQQRFGLDVNPEGPLPEREVTLAERLGADGWRTGMVGKWHLEPNPQTRAWNEGPGQGVGPEEQFARFGPGGQGFTEFFCGGSRTYRATFDGSGKTFEKPRVIVQDGDRIAVQTRAAVDFIQRNGGAPFFLYLAYFAPHTPLEATPEQLAATPPDLPLRRRHALAMLKAVDDGVGQVRAALREVGAADNTLIVFASDNGAPLARTMPDDKIEFRMNDAGWDGSLNEPLIGEKGMLTEGGIRVPMIWHWPGRLPAGRVHHEPVSTLDIVPTALAAAGLPGDPILDGRNVLPELAGKAAAERPLFWRVWHQAAVRRGSWKLVRVAERRFLFDLAGDGERTDLAARHPERAAALDRELDDWLATLSPPGLLEGNTSFRRQQDQNYSHHLPAFAQPQSGRTARPNSLSPHSHR